jgi:hypothetical protein
VKLELFSKSEEMMIQTLKIKEIRLDGGTQPREEIDWELVHQYSEHMTNGDKFPPIEVYHDGFEYWLVNGFHRLHAALKLNNTTIEAYVFNGDKSEAQWKSYAANKDQDTAGKRRTNPDKQRAVKAALMHPKAEKMSNREIALHVGVGETMVREYRNKIICANSADTTRTRIVTRGNQTYEMKLPEKKPTPVKPEPEQPESEINPPVFLCETGRQMVEAMQNQSEDTEDIEEPETHLTHKTNDIDPMCIADQVIKLIKTIPKNHFKRTDAISKILSFLHNN